MYIPRIISSSFRQALRGFPSVIITGPRQSGKTTFVKNEKKSADYVSFDDPMERDFARHDPLGFIKRFRKKTIILDEIQYLPEILQHIKLDIEKDRQGHGGGVMFEGLIVSETVKAFANAGLNPDLYFWRSHEGLEVDIILQSKGKLYPIEIKLTSTPTVHHINTLERFKKIAGSDAADMGVMICRVERITDLPFGNIALP
jgi:predicted AAA+ superfamily ATPase